MRSGSKVTVLPLVCSALALAAHGRWRERHPDLALEIDASPQIVDLQREGFLTRRSRAWDAGRGPGLESAERLFDAPMPLIVVGSPAAARRLLGAQPEMLARVRGCRWTNRNCGNAGCRGQRTVTTVAVFNDAGLMLQAAEQSPARAIRN